ncbi:MAG: leucine-rich repeat domain-containing protein [Clostridia bacterium]|nr:leucine-rich repeat domain-containing protein [Clostridia bacterium]
MAQSKGLKYVLDFDTNTYILNGVGTCTDEFIVIPDKINDKEVTAIANNAFLSSKIRGVYIPNSVKQIGANAFAKSLIESAYVDAQVTEFSNGVFSDCSQLEAIVIKSPIKKITTTLFSGCLKLKDISLPTNLETIEKNAFITTAFYNTKDNWDENNALYLQNYLIAIVDTNVGTYSIKKGPTLSAEDALYDCQSIRNLSFSTE